LGQQPFLASTAGFLLAGALLHNLLTGISLQRLLVPRKCNHYRMIQLNQPKTAAKFKNKL
jgi:hypothetical protein